MRATKYSSRAESPFLPGLKIDEEINKQNLAFHETFSFTLTKKSGDRSEMLLSCPLCSKPHFEGVDSLRTTLVNVATAPLTCPVCQETLKGLDKLTIHLFGHVNSNQVVSKGESDSARSHKCKAKHCNDSTKQEIDKSINRICTTKVQDPVVKPEPKSPLLKESPKPNDDVIVCDICSFTFNDRNILEMHQKLLHQTSPDEKTGKYSYHCHLCSKRFRMRGSLMVHLRVAHYGFNNHIDLSPDLIHSTDDVEKDTMEIDATSNGGTKLQDCKQWSCDVCAKMFTTKYFLKKHKRLHTGEMPYSCTICNKSFTFQQSYHKHMLYHSSEKPYVCNECGRAFKEHSTLQNHARIHSGERPFGCEICGKCFRQRVSYLVHMRIHTGVMPYKCTACNKSFRYKVSQRSHKCPINPPGSVIRIIDDGNNSTVSVPTVTADENNLLVSNRYDSMNPHVPSEGSENNAIQGTKCIMSVDYDTGNINIIPRNINGVNSVYTNMITTDQKRQKNDTIAQEVSLTNDRLMHHQTDIYSVAISPILPEVESLCLDSHSPLGDRISPIIEENIQTIRDKCLEELFK